MATSPAFVGNPRATITSLSSINYLAVAAFEAGTSGSIIRRIWANSFSDSPLSITLGIDDGTRVLYSKTVLLTVATETEGAAANFADTDDLLNTTMFPGVSADSDKFFELAPGETLVVTVHNGSGAAPEAGALVRLRVGGMDY